MRIAEASSVSRAALDSYHLGKLRSLLAEILARNPFYSAKLAGAGVLSPDNLSEFTSRVPFTYKWELTEDQAANPPFGSNLTYPLQCYTRFNQTSGTKGRPLRWLDTPETWQWMIDCWSRVFESAGVSRGDHVFFPFSFGPFLGFWLAFEAAGQIGCLVISGGGMRSPARLRTILDNEVTVLCITPSYAVHLAEIARAEGIDLSLGRVGRIIVAGEPGGSIPATRALIEKLWPGAKVVDHHGMTEVGPATYECPLRRGTLHMMEAAFFPEIIHLETGSPVQPGEIGELVLTSLGRVGSPLLRYRTGDIVRRAKTAPCVCGSSELALEGGIHARSDDMVIVRGVNVYPTAVEDVLRSCGVTEFRVETFIERSLAEMSIVIEPESECEDVAALVDRVATAMRNALSLRVKVTCLPHGSLPRFEGKANRWVRRS